MAKPIAIDKNERTLTAFEQKAAAALHAAFGRSGMTLKDFADACDVWPSTAHGWLNGTHGIRLNNLARAAEVLGIDVKILTRQDAAAAEVLAEETP